ncbi:hypothetical protein [Bacillus mycoides]|uniref:hypothetical protein n=1 Tax=Bacillus mycoides TaxID=1405 RepID=UPI003D65DCDD
MVDADMKLSIEKEKEVWERNTPLLGGRFIGEVREVLREKRFDEVLVEARTSVVTIFTERLRELTGQQFEVYALDASCCKKQKFSMHLHTTLQMQSHCVDAGIVGYALNACINLWIWKQSRADTPSRLSVVGAAFLWNWEDPPTTIRGLCSSGMVDVSVYSKNRLMRMYAQSKRGTNRPLREVAADGTLKNIPSDAGACIATYLQKYEINVSLGDDDSVVSVRMPEGLYVARSVHAAYQERGAQREFGITLCIPFWIDRFSLCTDKEKMAAKQKREPRVRGTPGEDAITSSPCKRAILILSTMVLYDEYSYAVLARDLDDTGKIVHCPLCDCEEGKKLESLHMHEQIGSPDGNPSAKTIRSKYHDMGVKCFNCQNFFLICAIEDYAGFHEGSTVIESEQGCSGYFPHEVLHNACKPYLARLSSRRTEAEASINAHHWVETGGCQGLTAGEGSIGSAERTAHNYGMEVGCIAINAGMGSGKTEAACALSFSPNVETVLIVTHRRALARQLAQRFAADCYLDMQRGALHAPRLVVCVNSVHRIPRDAAFDVVIVDEAGFVRRHLVGGTFDVKDALSTIKRIGILLSKATVFLLLQDALSEGDVDFFVDVTEGSSAIRNVPIRVRVHKFVFAREAVADRYHLTTDLALFLAILKHFVKQGVYAFVPCSQKAHAEALYMFILQHCKPSNISATKWLQRVALVTSSRLLPEDHFSQPEDFVERYKKYHVCVTTSVLETGVSMMDHYRFVFGLFACFPIAHSAQVQLANRVRDSEKTLIFAEKGTPFSILQRRKDIERIFNMHAACAEDVLLGSTAAAVAAEIADTINNNDILWAEVRKAETISVDNVSSHTWTPAPEPPLKKRAIMRIERAHSTSQSRLTLAKELYAEDAPQTTSMCKSGGGNGSHVEQDKILKRWFPAEQTEEKTRQDMNTALSEFWTCANQRDVSVQRYLKRNPPEQILKDVERIDANVVISRLIATSSLEKRNCLEGKLGSKVMTVLKAFTRIQTYEKTAHPRGTRGAGVRTTRRINLHWTLLNPHRIGAVLCYLFAVDHELSCLNGTPGHETFFSSFRDSITTMSVQQKDLVFKKNLARAEFGIFLTKKVYRSVFPQIGEYPFQEWGKLEWGKLADKVQGREPRAGDILEKRPHDFLSILRGSGGDHGEAHVRALNTKIRQFTPLRVSFQKRSSSATVLPYPTITLALIMCADPVTTVGVQHIQWHHFAPSALKVRQAIELFCTFNEETEPQPGPELPEHNDSAVYERDIRAFRMSGISDSFKSLQDAIDDACSMLQEKNCPTN